MVHQLPPLPYEKTALEPYVSAETLEYHHDKHHRAYVAKLNQLIRANEFENLPLEEIIRMAKGPLFNYAAQHWNHTFFWQCLSPNGGGRPWGEIAELIEKNFRTFEAFLKEYNQKVFAIFGSGWTWLVENGDGDLEIMNTSNADNPLLVGKKPLLTVDVWEHAYYIDYRNSRHDFMEGFWKIVNWDFVNQNFQGEMTFKGFGNKGHFDHQSDIH
jgi:Fe-Mn family superoxide dismutase